MDDLPHIRETHSTVCPDCADSGIVGDEGPGRRNAQHEWVPCDCPKGEVRRPRRADRYHPDWTDLEMDALAAMAKAKELSAKAVVRAAVRLYQAVHGQVLETCAAAGVERVVAADQYGMIFLLSNGPEQLGAIVYRDDSLKYSGMKTLASEVNAALTAEEAAPAVDLPRHADAGGIRSSDLVAIASEWRRDAEMHRNSCRLQEKAGMRDNANRHYQRSLDLDACAKRLEDLANVPALP